MPYDFDINGKTIIFIIIGILIVLFVIGWLVNRSNNSVQTDNNIEIGRNVMPYTDVGQHHSAIADTTSQFSNVPFESSNSNTIFTLYYFHNPNCSGCQKFNQIWNQIASKLHNVNNISLRPIDTTKLEHEQKLFYYNIEETPTIILTTPDKYIEHTGNKSIEDLSFFILTNLDEYARNPQYQIA